MSRLLTPKDVHQRIFSTHRFREGYDVDEVDDFLDVVADSIKRLGETCTDLSHRLEVGDLRLSLALADAQRIRGLVARRHHQKRRRTGR